MAFIDSTAEGQKFDKFKLIKDKEFFPMAFAPRLGLDGQVFIVNQIPCGWDRWNRCFRPVKDVSDNASEFSVVDSKSTSWDWDDSFMAHIRKAKMKKHSLEMLITEHHRVRSVYKDMSKEDESADEMSSAYITAGILDLMAWLNYGKTTITGIRLFLTKQNGQIVKVFEEKNGRGSFDEAFPFERLSSADLEKKGLERPDDYEFKLLKGLKILSWYRKPRKQAAIVSEADENDKNFIYALFS